MSKSNLKLELDDEIATDFRDSFSDHYVIISHCVMELEKNPDNIEFLDEIFRSLHTVKGNANMCQFELLTELTHSLENVVSCLREESLKFTQIIGEIILLTLDKIKEVSEDFFADSDIDIVLIKKVEDALDQIKSASNDDIPKYAQNIIGLITGHMLDSDTLTTAASDISFDTKSVEVKNLEEKNVEVKNSAVESTTESNKGLQYFSQLASLLETKIPYWNGRTQRTLPLVHALNEAIGSPVEHRQLDAATYMHDIAYAFLSESLVLADTKHSSEEVEQMHMHPRIASDLIRLTPGWEEATQIIAQHHEKWDGSGYPNGLKADAICKGAQILAIVDAYESMTHPRPDRQYKRSVLRAVTEINNYSESQFSPTLTSEFNNIIRKMMSKK